MICLFLLYRNHSLRKIFAMLFSAFEGIYLNISFLTCIVISTCTLFFHPNLHMSAGRYYNASLDLDVDIFTLKCRKQHGKNFSQRVFTI